MGFWDVVGVSAATVAAFAGGQWVVARMRARRDLKRFRALLSRLDDTVR